jgi:hypothetical protein
MPFVSARVLLSMLLKQIERRREPQSEESCVTALSFDWERTIFRRRKKGSNNNDAFVSFLIVFTCRKMSEANKAGRKNRIRTSESSEWDARFDRPLARQWIKRHETSKKTRLGMYEVSRQTELLHHRVERRSCFYVPKRKKNNSSAQQPLISGKGHCFVAEKRSPLSSSWYSCVSCVDVALKRAERMAKASQSLIALPLLKSNGVQW